jgi:hypothetical protein
MPRPSGTVISNSPVKFLWEQFTNFLPSRTLNQPAFADGFQVYKYWRLPGMGHDGSDCFLMTKHAIWDRLCGRHSRHWSLRQYPGLPARSLVDQSPARPHKTVSTYRCTPLLTAQKEHT